ncbi:MAG: hypothetical protein PF569_03990 [Candidatus Woesearchaeota archaeon]|jgi:uncharacterized protein (UPF0332 family)|nr:hypothetical protein [Candidatus Woesearchaeota archaeon]
MDLTYKLYLDKAKNELDLARIIFEISNSNDLKNSFSIDSNETFFSAVITHSYYSIFYCAKAYLLKNNIKTKAPEEHKKTYEEFEKLVEDGKIDLELLNYYQELILKAEELLGIFKLEKKKRGEFTYQKLSQANLLPSKNSLDNAKLFFKNIYNLLEN